MRRSHRKRKRRAMDESDRETDRGRERERGVGDWSYETVVMATSDHEGVKNDQRRKQTHREDT